MSIRSGFLRILSERECLFLERANIYPDSEFRIISDGEIRGMPEDAAQEIG